jgi:hypothetical protein
MNRKAVRTFKLDFSAAEVIAALKAAYPEDILIQSMPKLQSDYAKFGDFVGDRLGTLYVEWTKETKTLPGTPGNRGSIMRYTGT